MGTDTSCLTLLLCLASDSVMRSRKSHKSAACLPDSAITPSCASPLSKACSSAFSTASLRPDKVAPASINTYQALASIGHLMPKCCSTSLMEYPEINSKAEIESPNSFWAQTRKSSAFCGSATLTRTVTVCVGRGRSRSTAAVTMPSVPSVPIKTCFQSYPALSLRKCRKPFTMLPSGSTTSRPKTKARVMP